MLVKINSEAMVPKLMKLVKFHGSLSIDEIRRYTNYGKASINSVLNSMIKHGLIIKQGKQYKLSENSKHWLGWKSFNN